MASQKYHILKEYANGVMDEKGRFFPYKSQRVSATISGKQGVRYFIKRCHMSAQKSAASAAQSATFSATVKGVTSVIFVGNLPETFAASNDVSAYSADIGILCDNNTDIVYGGATINLTIILAEVLESEGEYSG